MRSKGRPTTLRAKLWKGWSLVALLIVTLFTADFVKQGKQPTTDSGFGLDFVAFYRAGVLVHTGHADRLYNLQDTRDFDRSLAETQKLDLGKGYGAFLNPPFFAWIFAPLVTLGYWKSLVAWLLINLSCFTGAAVLLCRIIPKQDDPDPNLEPFRDWRDWALVPALMAVSYPFMENIGHAQNTFISLLLMTLAVIAWRDGRALFAGIVAGILFYKPQLAAVILAAMVITLGWRALAGAFISLGSLLLINVLTLRGTLTDYLHRLTPNVQYYLATHPYLWRSHATFNGFWHVALGPFLSAVSPTAEYLAIICAMPIAFGLLLCVWRNRKSTSRDRMIAAVIAAAPLVMPYYLDYDLLLLAIPAVLLATEVAGSYPAQPLPSRDVWLLRLWAAFYLLLLINPGLTGILHVNLSVPLLAAIAGLLIARATPSASSLNSQTDSNNSPDSFQRPMAA
jgi:alpha-1,2-mannosyltransferase